MPVTLNEMPMMPETTEFETAHSAIAQYNLARTDIARRMSWRFRVVVTPVIILAAAWTVFFISHGERLFRPPGGQILTYILSALAVAVCILVVFLAREPGRVLQNAFLGRLLPLLFSFAQGVSHYRGGQPSIVERVAALKLVGFLQSDHDSTVSGIFQGRAFVITEARLTSGTIEIAGVRKTITSFRGVILQMTRHTAFPGRLLVRDRRSPVLTAPVPAWPDRAGTLTTGNQAVDERYALSVEPHDLETRPLSPSDVASLAAFCAMPAMRGADIAIIDQDCFIFLPTRRDIFQLPSIRTNFDYERHAVPMVEDMAIFLEALRLAAGIGAPAS